MNILHVSPSFFPATHLGGPIHSGFGLCNALMKIPGVQLRVITTDTDGPNGRMRLDVKAFPQLLPEGYYVYYCRKQFGRDISLSMFLRLWPLIRWANLVHLNAVYSPPTIPTLLLCKLMRKPVVWSTRGALQRWPGTTRKTIKYIWERLCNALCHPKRVVLHATSEEERKESLTRIRRATAIVLPNGVETPGLENVASRASRKEFHLLYLGRLHPIKGIENLLRAVALGDPDLRLSICGDGAPSYRRTLDQLVESLGLTSRVTFKGQIDEAAKGRYFQDADLVVVPSFKEAFCIVVAESLAHGVPVIASTETPWQMIDQVGCGMWVANDPRTLAEAIERARQLPLSEMGARGREWMRRDFSWVSIAGRMAAEYDRLILVNAKNSGAVKDSEMALS